MSNHKDLISKILASGMLDSKSAVAEENARRVLEREELAGRHDDEAHAAGWKGGLSAGLTVPAVAAVVAAFGVNVFGLIIGLIVGASGAALVWMWRGQVANARLQALWIRLKPATTEPSSG